MLKGTLRIILLTLFLQGCSSADQTVSQSQIDAINLKRGTAIACSPGETLLGDLSFEISCTDGREAFNRGVKFLHSFEYDEAEKMFAKVIDEEPACAMAYWGVAMSNFCQLWRPSLPAELEKGGKAIEIARSIKNKTPRETDYIEAIGAYYKDWQTNDHRTRSLAFETAMKALHAKYPTDKEAAVFYALALNTAADPADKSYKKQKEAGAILHALYQKEPNHPGVVHYIIHSFDSPELANLALGAARKYASVAPSSAHALHMPSHIFTRLGLWQEGIQSNLQSVSAAKCYAEEAGLQGHWDEELHGLDYLMYGYLQAGDNIKAKDQWNYLNTIRVGEPLNFKVAHAFAAIPSRYLLENRLWKEAANLQVSNTSIPRVKFSWEKAIIHFTRLMGAVQLNDLGRARVELDSLSALQQKLTNEKEVFNANKVLIQVKVGNAWINWKEGKRSEALAGMNEAADLEDKTGKHPVTPGEVIPARELLGDLLMQMQKPADALIAYEASVAKAPNRLNGLYGACMAAYNSGNMDKAKQWYKK